MKTRLIPSLFLLVVGSFLVTSNAHAQSVSVSASPSTITTDNDNDEATITLTVSPPATRTIEVNFIMTGTAALGRDYVLIGDFNRRAQLVIPAGQSTSTITLHALGDDDGAFNETVVFNIYGGKGYRVGRPPHAQVTIQNQN